MRVQAEAYGLTSMVIETFEVLYRRAQTAAEQDQVTKAFQDMITGWQTNQDSFALIRRGFLDDLDEPEDPASFAENLRRSQVTFLKPDQRT